MIVKFEYKGITSKYNTDDGYFAKWKCRLNKKTVKFNNPEYIIKTIDKYKEAKKMIGMTLYTIERETNSIKKVILTDIDINDEMDSFTRNIDFIDQNGKIIYESDHYVEEKDISLLQKDIDIEEKRLELMKEFEVAYSAIYKASVFRRF